MGCGRVLKILAWRSREEGLCVNCTLFMLILGLYGKNSVLLAVRLCGECGGQLVVRKLLP